MTKQRTIWPDDERVRGESVAASLIHWKCKSEQHRAAPSRGGRGGLTVFLGRWAYCDGLVDDDLHVWEPTGGVTIDALVDWTKALGVYRGWSVRR